jgi:uncharacterized membrane protein YccC
LPVSSPLAISGLRPDTWPANRKELADDLVKKVKQIELLISSLPDPPDPARFDAEYAALEAEEREAEDAYMAAVEEASASVWGLLCRRLICRTDRLDEELEKAVDFLIDQKADRDAP